MRVLLLLPVLFLFSSCKKFLDKKPDKKLIIPTELAELSLLLDDSYKLNMKQPGSGEASADNYYLHHPEWASIPNVGNRNQYIWGAELYFSVTPNEWSQTYDVVYVSNVILEEIVKMNKSLQPEEWNRIKGSALFFRAHNFWKALQLWAKAYDTVTAHIDPGVPIRLNANFNEPSLRASVKEGFLQIIKDLKEACLLLPMKTKHVLLPSKPTAFAMLARTFLSMGFYREALAYSDTSLLLYPNLLDYNNISGSSTYSFPAYNEEVLFYAAMSNPPAVSPTRAKIDSVLYLTYEDDDLRKTLFFRSNSDNSFRFRGSYTGSIAHFTGLANDEVYLIRSECRARLNDVTGAMSDLNHLLRTRWKEGSFVERSAITKEQAIDIILEERRKELIMRDLRWSDIKRLNREGAGIHLTRVLDGTVYELSPNDPRFALPLPGYIVDITGMPQNPR